MRVVRIEPTLDAWRAAARALLHARIPPADVAWREAGDAQAELLPDAGSVPDIAPGPGAFRVPRRFVDLAQAVACHADRGRWAALYRVLWRLTSGEPRLLEVAVDDDVHRLLRMDKAVRREIHKVHAFVRFRRVGPRTGDAPEHFVAWLETEHDCLPLAAPFFARRFPNMRWSILGPRRSAHWDGTSLRLDAGLARDAAPAGDELEVLWRTYYANIFNPARVRPGAMLAEMPRKYWHALPEASLVSDLIADAPARVKRMLEAEARPPRRRRGGAS